MDAEYKHNHYIKNKERYKELHKKWVENNKGINKKYKDRWYKDNAEKLRSIRLNAKLIVYEAYGNKCSCCGESNIKFLSIDHVNNDGYKERKGRGGSSDHIMRNIIKNKFPDTYQLLCFNCNLGKARNGGICPHKDMD